MGSIPLGGTTQRYNRSMSKNAIEHGREGWSWNKVIATSAVIVGLLVGLEFLDE
jgi:hypothetical protein